MLFRSEAIRNPEQTRKILENYQQADMDLSHVQIPDYQHLEKPLMEVFTLDSASCAACSYMLLAAERATQAMQGKIDMVEYKMTNTENIARLKKMGIQNLPSIVINGELKFSSLIPSQQELIETIQKFFV